MKHLVRHLASRLPWGRKETPGMKRVREACEIYDRVVGEYREQMRRENPGASEEQISDLVRAWLLDSPCESHPFPEPHPAPGESFRSRAMAKPLNLQDISALLEQAGHSRSKPRPALFQRKPDTEGFIVSRGLFGSEARVEHSTGTHMPEPGCHHGDEALSCYTETLTAAGYRVERDKRWPGLNVTAGTETGR